MNLLTTSFPDWSFNLASQDILGSFDLYRYKAIGTTSGYRASDAPGFIGGIAVGAELQFGYSPGYGDPDSSNVHWIQWVRNNHAVTPNCRTQAISEQHGQNDSKIDIAIEQTKPTLTPQESQYCGVAPGEDVHNPFYDTFFRADEYYFHDVPNRKDIKENHNWIADLYLVEEVAPKTVNIYNGIRWGWENTFDPTSPPPPPPPPCNGGSGGGGCSAASIRGLAVRDSSSVPEPASILGLLVLGTGGILAKLIQRKDESE
ncbi:MAG: PEP-CTERM sorting domain-containing protein [Cyanobacteriota bacterium]|nr:PEP-CTERM sorting domain-containing protein [Cyanobacteriota bacterium]